MLLFPLAGGIAPLCFLPGRVLVRRLMQVFQCCATSRAQGAEEAA